MEDWGRVELNWYLVGTMIAVMNILRCQNLFISSIFIESNEQYPYMMKKNAVVTFLKFNEIIWSIYIGNRIILTDSAHWAD